VYGLVCGLGFGIREGVLYQTGSNVVAAQGNLAIYYLENMLRLTSLPFLHAIWTGIAGYFIGYAYEYRQRQAGLLIVAIGLPAILHGCYDVFSDSLLGVGIAAFSVLVLGLYLQASEHFRTTLEETTTAGVA
jgi:RsiW-degrading membrane proteinase PrsW (M82 family)